MSEIIEPIPGRQSFGGLAPLLATQLPVSNNDKRISYKTVQQKRITNCPVAALLAAMAHAMPSRLERMIRIEKPAKPQSVKFKDDKDGHTGTAETVIRVDFPGRSIVITPWLFLDEGRSRELLPRFGASTDGTGWVSYFEKAYVTYRCQGKYSNLDLLGNTSTPLTVARIVDDFAYDFNWFRLDERELWHDPEPVLSDPPTRADPNSTILPDDYFQAEERAITPFNRDAGMRRTLHQIFSDHDRKATIVTTHNHTLAVVGYDKRNRKVTLYDPMRQTNSASIDLSEFLERHDGVYQVVL